MKFFVVIISLFMLSSNIFGQKSPVTVYLAGDSTMAEKLPEKRPETGWGEKLQQYFDAAKVKIDNRAQNGRSTRTFIGEGRWQSIVDALKKGDYVFIQFGHNDESKEKVDRYTPPADFKKNLEKFVAEVRAKKAIPVLLTPVMRRRFNEKGEFYDTHGEYPDLTRRVAKDLKVALIDMHLGSEKVLKDLGAEKSRSLFLHLKPDENSNYAKGVEDNTHFNEKGAAEMAQIAVAEIKKSKIGLRKFLQSRSEFKL